MAKITLDSIVAGFKSVSRLISNFNLIENALNDKVLYRDNPTGEPNQMMNELDMNSQRIINLPSAQSNSEPITLGQAEALSAGILFASTQLETQTATAAQTVFILATMSYGLGVNNMAVYINGVYQSPTTYSEDTPTQITFSEPLVLGDTVDFVSNQRPVSSDSFLASNVVYTPPGEGATNVQSRLALYEGTNGADEIIYTGSGGVDVSVQSKLRNIVSILDFVTEAQLTGDISTEVQAAIDYLETLKGGSLYFPARDETYKFINITVNAPIKIYGDGQATILEANGTGYMFDVAVDTGIIANREHSLYGFELTDLKAIGTTKAFSLESGGLITGQPDAGMLRMTFCDHFRIDNIHAEHFARQVLKFATKCREGVINNLHTRYCGNVDTGYSVISITEDSAGNDGHNNLFFTNCYIIYNLGIAINISTNPLNPLITRNIYFDNVMIHGTVSVIQGQAYTYTAAQQNLVQVQCANCDDIFFNKVRFHSAGFDSPCVNIVSDANVPVFPRRYIFDSCQFNPHGDWGVPAGGLHNGIKAGRADINVSSCIFNKQDSPILDSADTTVFFDNSNNIMSNNTALPKNGTYPISEGFDVVPRYETGAWAPELWDTSNSGSEGQTYAAQSGTYTRTGNVVHCQGRIAMSSLGSLAGAELAQIGNLPFTVNAHAGMTVGRALGLALAGAYGVTAYAQINSNRFILSKFDGTTGSSNMTVTQVSATGDIIFSMTYTTTEA